MVAEVTPVIATEGLLPNTPAVAEIAELGPTTTVTLELAEAEDFQNTRVLASHESNFRPLVEVVGLAIAGDVQTRLKYLLEVLVAVVQVQSDELSTAFARIGRATNAATAARCLMFMGRFSLGWWLRWCQAVFLPRL